MRPPQPTIDTIFRADGVGWRVTKTGKPRRLQDGEFGFGGMSRLQSRFFPASIPIKRHAK
jgi:hypothetical protein